MVEMGVSQHGNQAIGETSVVQGDGFVKWGVAL